jgi:phenylacetate-CoA ligase
VVPDARWNDAAREAVSQGLRARLGATVAVELKLLDAIAPEASGKHRYVVSHVSLQNGLAQADNGWQFPEYARQETVHGRES